MTKYINRCEWKIFIFMLFIMEEGNINSILKQTSCTVYFIPLITPIFSVMTAPFNHKKGDISKRKYEIDKLASYWRDPCTSCKLINSHNNVMLWCEIVHLNYNASIMSHEKKEPYPITFFRGESTKGERRKLAKFIISFINKFIMSEIVVNYVFGKKCPMTNKNWSLKLNMWCLQAEQVFSQVIVL